METTNTGISQRSQQLVLMLLGLIITFGLGSEGFAQGGARGAVAVTVADPSGAIIPGAQVEIINQETGITERTVTTAGDGKVIATLLPVGLYRVVVTASGFAKSEARDIRVRVTETTSVTVAVQVGGVTEAVTVTATPAVVETTTPTTGETLQTETIGNLPLSTRNFLTLLTLSAGANTELFDSAALGRGQVTINVNGQRPVNNNYQLEGINANDFNLPILDNVPLPNPQTVDEFKTQTSLYDASQGRNGGGNIQVALKSGTSEYHGDVFEFFRNDKLNANDFFLNRRGQRRPNLKQNQYGFSFGGPIPKQIPGSWTRDFFFFGNYQGTKSISGISNGTTVATNIPVLPAVRSEANLAAAFFPSGLPPGFTRLDPVALRFLNLPASKCPGFNDGTNCIPTLPGTPGFTRGRLNLANLTRSRKGRFDDDQFTLTMDKQLTSKNKITGRWFFSEFETINPFATGSSLPFAKGLPNKNRFLKLGLTRVMSPKMVNDFRFGFNRFVFAQKPVEPIKLTDIGATRGNSSEFPAAYRAAISGSFSIGTGVNDDRGGTFNTYVWGDDFSVTLGKHQIRMGFDVTRYQLNRFNRFATRGSVAFGNTSAGAGGAGIPSLVGFQNFLLGRITSTQGAAGIFSFFFRASDYAGYIQDDFRVNPRLTMNLGLRWEGLSTAHEHQNFLSNFVGNGDGTVGPLRIIHPSRTPRVGTPGVSECTLITCFDSNNFGPRVGFALDLFGNQKTVLRSGYGVYFQRTSNQPLLQTSGGLPFSQAISASAFSVTTANPFPSSRPTSDFPLPFDQVVPRLLSFNARTGAPVFESASGGPLSGFFFFPRRDFHAPYAQQWNLTIEQELFKGWLAEVGYVGTRGVRLLGPGRPANPGKICTDALPCVIPQGIASNVTVPAGTPGVTKRPDGTIQITESTEANINARVPVQFLGLANSRGFFQEQSGQSTYHSLQASLVHKYSNGLYFQGAYTFSRSLDNGSGSAFVDELNGLTQFGDLFDARSNFALSDFDRTHRIVISYNYELPFAKLLGIENRGFGRAFHGWSINGVTTLQSGTPFTVFDSGAVTLQDTDFVNTTNKAVLKPGASRRTVLTRGSTKKRLDNYVDLNAFVSGGNCVDKQNAVVPCDSPASTGFAATGDLGRNVYRGPFQKNWDLSIIKTTKIHEQYSVDFRAEFFNVWNNPSFQSPQAAGGSLGNLGQVDVASGDSSILATVNRPRIIQFAIKINF